MKYLILAVILLTGCLPPRNDQETRYYRTKQDSLKLERKPNAIGLVQSKTQRDGYLVPEEKDGKLVWAKYPPRYFIEISYDENDAESLFAEREELEVGPKEYDQITVGDAWFNGKHYPRPKDE